MKNKINKVLIVVIVILSLVIISGGIYYVYSNRKDNNVITNQTGGKDNDLLNGEVWYNDTDNSVLVFPNDQNFVWYADTNYENSNNYMSGYYDFYLGQDAYGFIKDLYKDDEQTLEYDENMALLALYIASSVSDGNENISDGVISKCFFGYYHDDLLSFIDMQSLEEYDFYSQIENTSASNGLVNN